MVAPVCREVLEARVLLASEVLHGSLEGGVVAGHDVLLSLQSPLPLLPLPPCAAYLGTPLAQGLLCHYIWVRNMLWALLGSGRRLLPDHHCWTLMVLERVTV